MSKRAFVSQAGWFSFHYPEHWEVDEDEFISVYDPQDGVGAMVLSSYQAPEVIDPSSELLDHLSSDNPAIRSEDIRVLANNQKIIASYERVDERSFHKVWFIAHGSQLVVATYDNASEYHEKEVKEIEEIVKSIEIMPGISRN